MIEPNPHIGHLKHKTKAEARSIKEALAVSHGGSIIDGRPQTNDTQEEIATNSQEEDTYICMCMCVCIYICMRERERISE